MPSHRTAAEAPLYDVCVIGSGAAGAVVAEQCVRQNLHVLLVERGQKVASRASYWNHPAVHGIPCRIRDLDGHWRRDGRSWTSSNLGGGTVYYGAVSFRYRELDFAPSPHLSSEMAVDWPIRYSELAPYYDQMERRLRVARENGKDPTAPPMPPSSFPSHPPSVRGTYIAEGALKHGLRPFATPLAINSVSEGDRGSCVHCSDCIDYPCPNGAKSDVVTSFLAPIFASPNFVLMMQTQAVRLLLGQGDKVDALQCYDLADRITRRFRARYFVLAGGAIQSAALLLRSRSHSAPRGLGNSQGLVGRGMGFKMTEYVVGRIPNVAPMPPEAYYGPFSTIAITDHYRFDGGKGALGGLIYESFPGYALRHAKEGVWIGLEVMIADCPRPTNRVVITPDRPIESPDHLTLDYQTHPEDRVRLARLSTHAAEILAAAGCHDIHTLPSHWHLGSAHFHGTCRAGTESKTSVTTASGRLHDVANVLVADGATMPYPGGVHPTLTIQANALRIATELTRSLRRESASHASRPASVG